MQLRDLQPILHALETAAAGPECQRHWMSTQLSSPPRSEGHSPKHWRRNHQPLQQWRGNAMRFVCKMSWRAGDLRRFYDSAQIPIDRNEMMHYLEGKDIALRSVARAHSGHQENEPAHVPLKHSVFDIQDVIYKDKKNSTATRRGRGRDSQHWATLWNRRCLCRYRLPTPQMNHKI